MFHGKKLINQMFTERAVVTYLTMFGVITYSESQLSLHIPTFSIPQFHSLIITDLQSQENVPLSIGQ